jgi:hypothetical protein
MTRTSHYFGVLILVAMSFIGCLTSCGATPTHVIKGRLSLTDFNADWTPGAECDGENGFSDIQSGGTVTVKNGNGDVIAVGSLGSGVPASLLGITSTCDFPISVSEVPEVNFYQIYIGNRSPSDYTLKQMKSMGWNLSLSLGS